MKIVALIFGLCHLKRVGLNEFVDDLKLKSVDWILLSKFDFDSSLDIESVKSKRPSLLSLWIRVILSKPNALKKIQNDQVLTDDMSLKVQSFVLSIIVIVPLHLKQQIENIIKTKSKFNTVFRLILRNVIGDSVLSKHNGKYIRKNYSNVIKAAVAKSNEQKRALLFYLTFTRLRYP